MKELKEALEILDSAGIIVEKRIPKYKQRELNIDAGFEKLGLSLEEYMKIAQRSLDSEKSLGISPYGEGFFEKRPYDNVTWYYLVTSDGIYKSYDDLRNGDCYAYGEIKFLLEEGEIRVDCVFSEVVDTRYNTSRYYVTKKIGTPEPIYVKFTSDPEADIKKVIDYIKTRLEELQAAAESRREDNAARDETKGKYSWAQVRAYIEEESLWNLEEADREGMSGYLILGKKIPFAVYGPSGKVKVCRDAIAWMRNSFRFSKMKLFWYGTLPKERIEAANEALENAKDSEEIGRILCNLDL